MPARCPFTHHMIITLVDVFSVMSAQEQQSRTASCPLCGTGRELIGHTYSDGSPFGLFACEPCGLFWREEQ